MARKNPEPIITYEAILAMAGQHIQSEIIKLCEEESVLLAKLTATGMADEAGRLREGTARQVAYHTKRLDAIETMYRFQTGTELGMIAELGYAD